MTTATDTVAASVNRDLTAGGSVSVGASSTVQQRDQRDGQRGRRGAGQQ